MNKISLQRREYNRNRRHDRAERIMRLISPTYPNQYDTTALMPSDFSDRLINNLAPFDAVGNQNFFWRSTVDVTPVSQVALTDTVVAYVFRVNDSPGVVDLLTVFDQYRLRGATLTLSPQKPGNFNATDIVPRLWTCLDYDDSNTVTRSQILQYDTVAVTPPAAGVTRSLVPRMALAAYGSGAFTSYANVEPQWIDAASPLVEHYGVKLVVEAGAAGQTNLQRYSLSITTFWEFRATR
jgi:hypothetical protein